MEVADRHRRPQRSVVGVGASFIVIMAAAVAVGVLALGSIQHDFETLAEKDFPAFDHLVHVDRDLFRAQHALESGLSTDGPGDRVQVIEEYRSQVERTENRWMLYLETAYDGEIEAALQLDYSSARVAWLTASEELAGLVTAGSELSDPEVAAILAESRRHLALAHAAVHTIEEDLYEPLVENGIGGPAFDARWILILLLGGGIVVGGAVWVVAMRDSTRQVAELRERDHTEEQLVIRATHDPLTGLPNRAALLEILDEMVESSRGSDQVIAVLFLDLDNFMIVNDSLGHAAGDELLKSTADRVAGAVRGCDVVGRLGGDEFLVLCPGPISAEEAMRIARRVLDAIRTLELSGREVHATLSIGVALQRPGDTAEDLLAAADAAAYEAKSNGRDRVELFDTKLRHRAQEQLDLIYSLRRSLDRGSDLTPHYQPIVDLAHGETVGFEALCRWHHPERGLLEAGSFVDVADRHGLDVAVSWSIMRDAGHQIARWASDPSIPDPITTNVNVSARQLHDQNFAMDVRRCLDETGVSPDHLCIEVTERTIVADLDRARETLNGLRHIGLRVAIVAAVIRMSKALGHTVVAKGIETIDQIGTLQALRCDRGQGYLFSAALPPEAATELLTGERTLDSQAVQND